ncbi:MAG: PIG-L family deacetylase [Patescibacteria group bacterium]|nr:PIG-L family deacetylase [Patescibacteria group bacterium]
MIRKLVLLTIAGALLIFLGTFLYFRHYQNLPEFAVPLLSEAKIPAKGEKVIVFAPHCDDETLGVGGYIAKSVKNGADVVVVLMTNGDGHRFSSIEEFRKIYPNANNYIQSGYTRQEESKKALEILGVKDENILFLGYPDGGLKELLFSNFNVPYQSPYTKQSSSPYNNSYHQNVVYTGGNLENDLLGILKKYQPQIVITTSQFDIHSDHAATGIFVQKAVDKIDPPIDGQKPTIYYYLIHFRHFPSPKGLHSDRMLVPPAKLITISDGVLKVSLDKETLDLKEKALSEYKSQLRVPTLKNVMESFLRQNELLFTPK